jgi:hypothetical protein
MIYPGEYEIGYDATEIGFPSIMGCRAIVLVNATGLNGFHLLGKLNAVKRDAFVNFVNTHGGAGKEIYAASHEIGEAEKASQNELKDIAERLNFTGSIYWAKLGTVCPAGSAYVYFRLDHSVCGIEARTWTDATDNVPLNKAPYAAGVNRAMALGGEPKNMYIHVNPAGLQWLYPKRCG